MMSSASRRDFLRLSRDALLWLSAALGLGGALRFLDYDPNPAPKTEFDLGLAQDFPPGSRTFHPKVPAVLFHSQAGFSALSLVCTHLGCTLENDGQDFRCPCHGSQFDSQGQVTHGPATQALHTLPVEIDQQGHLILHTSTTP